MSMLGRDFVAFNQGVLRLSGPKTKKRIKRRHEQRLPVTSLVFGGCTHVTIRHILIHFTVAVFSKVFPCFGPLPVFSKISRTRQADPVQKFKRCEACEAVQQCLEFDIRACEVVKFCRVQDLEKRLQEQKEKEERAEQEMLEVWIWGENGEREQTAETKVLKLETKYERTRLPRFSRSQKKGEGCGETCETLAGFKSRRQMVLKLGSLSALM